MDKGLIKECGASQYTLKRITMQKESCYRTAATRAEEWLVIGTIIISDTECCVFPFQYLYIPILQTGIDSCSP